MEEQIKFVYKFTREAVQASEIHRDLIKMEACYDLKRIYCLMDHIVWELNFDSSIIIESEIPCVYIHDFSISSANYMVIGGWAQSGNEPLKFISLGENCVYNWIGRPERSDIIWISKSKYGSRHSNHYELSKDIINMSSIRYVNFIYNRNEFIAFGENFLYKIGYAGEIILKIAIYNVCFNDSCHNKIIDTNSANVFVSAYNVLKIYRIDDFDLIEKINFHDRIYLVKALNEKDAVVILYDGTVYFVENSEKKELIKINKEIVAFEFDKENKIFYFGNSLGEVFAINNKLNVIFQSVLDDSIRDIIILNHGKHILFGGKNVNFFLFENKKVIKVENNDEFLFRKGEGDGMKKVFLSYTQKDSDLADFVDTALLNKGIRLTRDVRDINYRQSIKEFMKSIRKSDYVFIIISKDYLQSPACMFEILELIKDENYKDRIIPIVRDTANIFEINGRANYIMFWQSEFENLQKKSHDIDILNRTFYIDELKKIESIQRNLPEFLSLVSDMKLITCKGSIIADSELELIIKIIS